MNAVTRAMRSHRMLCFDYRKPGQRHSRRRRVHPYHLACVDNQWYLFGLDLDRRDIRTFALGRLRRAEVTPTSFPVPAAFNITDYLRGSFGVLRGTGDHNVVIEFDPWATDLIGERRWNETRQFELLDGGRSRLTLRLTTLGEIERWVLNWGTHATVIEPAGLRERLGRIARELSRRYDDCGTGGHVAGDLGEEQD